MARWTPDPSFYPSARLAMEAEPGALRLRRAARARPVRRGPTRSACSTSSPAPPPTGRSSRRSRCRTPATSCTTSAGTPAARRSARRRRTRTSSGATWSCPACASSRIHILDTKPDPRAAEDREDDRAGRAGQQDRLLPPAHRPLRPGRDLHERARRRERRRRGRAASSCSTTSPSTRSARGRSIAGRSTTPTTSGGTSATTRDHQRVGHAGHVRERRRAGAAARPRVRPRDARLGPAQAPATCRRSTSAPSTRWCSSCGRRTTRARPTGSSASSSRSRTCRPRSGSGTATASDWKIQKVIAIPAEPAEPDLLPPLLKGFGAVPPLVTDINLSLDDRFLYVSCWGTGEFLQYDVSDPFNPQLTGQGAARRHRRPRGRIPSSGPLNGGPQMVEMSAATAAASTSRTRSTPPGTSSSTRTASTAGSPSWTSVEAGGMQLDPDFLTTGFDGRVPHQVRLEGGDASSDSYCFS